MKPLRLEIDTCLQDLLFNSIMDVISLKVHDNVFDNVKLKFDNVDFANKAVYYSAFREAVYNSTWWGNVEINDEITER